MKNDRKKKYGYPLRVLLACICAGMGLGLILGVATGRFMFGVYYGPAIGLVVGLFLFVLLIRRKNQ